MIIPRLLPEEYISSSELVLQNACSSRSVLSNGKRPSVTKKLIGESSTKRTGSKPKFRVHMFKTGAVNAKDPIPT